jgi:hypothetical protein
VVTTVSEIIARMVLSSEQRAELQARLNSPPEVTGLTHWSSYKMAKYLKQHEGISVLHNFVSHYGGSMACSRIGRGPTDPDFALAVPHAGIILVSPQPFPRTANGLNRIGGALEAILNAKDLSTRSAVAWLRPSE